jgi:hypothetical protein
MARYFFYCELHQVNNVSGVNSPGAGIQAFTAKPASVNSGQDLILLAASGHTYDALQAVIRR